MTTLQEIDTSTFKSWLVRGLGRAAVFLEEHDATPYQEALLYACTHNLSYDSQCEDSRAPYLWKLIELSKNQTFFREGVLRALRERGDNDDDSCAWRQIFGLARHFAAQGDTEVKQAMYSAFECLGFNRAADSSAQLIILDGLEGFLYAASQFNIDDPDREVWEFDLLMCELEENLGKELAANVFAKKARNDHKLARLLEALLEYRSRLEEKERKLEKSPPLSDYSVLKGQINRDSNTLRISGLPGWGEAASSVELLAAANDLLMEEDERKLAAYLRIFWRRPFPTNIDRLLVLANDERKRVRHSAVTALRNVRHPLVRELALSLLSSVDRSEDGIELLCSNLEHGDFALVERALLRSDNDDSSHGIGSSMLALLERHLGLEAVKSLLLVYEKTPCSICRAGSVRFLIGLGKLPDWMRRECLNDANDEIVKLVTSPK